MRIAIVGSGFGGLAAAVQCDRAGFADLTVFERAAAIGGVWRDNTYPGSACDVPTHLYSYSFAPKGDWSRKFATQPEILEYMHEVVRRFGLTDRIRLGTEVCSAHFDEATSTWRLELSAGATFEADVLIAACGQLSRPAYPALLGMDTFAGKAFHSAEWDHDHDLTGRAVAVIGTGASAIQFVPEVAKVAGSVTVFQRSAPFVIAKGDATYDRPLRPVSRLARRWATYGIKELLSYRFNHRPGAFARLEAGFARYLHGQVADEALRAKVMPSDRMGCKRILVSNEYYRSLDAAHVSVVDQPVTEVRRDSVVTADGAEHPADTVIYGTGFRATEFLAPMAITGRGNRELSEAWRDGAEAYLGITVPGFPNLFLVYGPNTNLGHNSIIFMIECQVHYILQALGRMRRRDLGWLEVHPDVHSAFNTRIQQRSRKTVFAQGCVSWYRSGSGKYTANWPGSTVAYWLRTRRLLARQYRWGAPVAGRAPSVADVGEKVTV